jgi:glycerol dehydrogenase-like iron-containing ADH family enzyme
MITEESIKIVREMKDDAMNSAKETLRMASENSISTGDIMSAIAALEGRLSGIHTVQLEIMKHLKEVEDNK